MYLRTKTNRFDKLNACTQYKLNDQVHLTTCDLYPTDTIPIKLLSESDL